MLLVYGALHRIDLVNAIDAVLLVIPHGLLGGSWILLSQDPDELTMFLDRLDQHVPMARKVQLKNLKGLRPCVVEGHEPVAPRQSGRVIGETGCRWF